MSRPLRLEYPGAIWHVTSRGNERQQIFFDDRDRARFVELLGDVIGLRRWVLHAWVLMRNHYHLLVETPEAPALSAGVKRLNEGYAAWFNTRHGRVGHLFQGRYKGILVERESHLLALIRYVVLNPVRCGAVRYAGDWRWSNYRATAGLSAAPSWLEIDWTLDQFDPADRMAAHEAYRRFVAEGAGASYKPWEGLVGQLYLGGAEFCDRMQELVRERPRSRAHPRCQRQIVRPSVLAIVQAVCEELRIDETELRRKSRGEGRKLFARLAWEEGGLPMAAIAEWLGVTGQAVSKLIESASRMETDSKECAVRMALLRKRLS